MMVTEGVPVSPVSLSSAVRADLRSSSGVAKLALLGAVGWLFYEWGAGNESLTPWMLARVIGSVDGVGVVPATAAVGFTFTTLQQLASGFTALYGFSLFERTSRAAWHRLTSRRDEPPVSWHTLSLPAKCLLVFGFGSTAVALLQITTTGRVGVRTHSVAIVQSALTCGAIVGSIGASVATAAWLGRRSPALSDTTEWIIRVLGNPLFWIGLLGLGVIISSVKKRLRRRSELAPSAHH
jgi:hypothetical protein